MWSKEKFLSDIKVGEIGEEKTLEYLYSRDFTQEVIDVRDDDFWRDNDVDFIFSLSYLISYLRFSTLFR